MTPKNRERAYDKRRYEEWQSRLVEKQAHTRKVRQRLAIGGGSVVVVLVILAAFLLANEGKDDSTSAASSTPAASASAAATTAATDAKSTCPAVDVKAPTDPKQTDKVPSTSIAADKTWSLGMKTTCGDITISLDGKAAPQAVSSMIQLAKDGFYDGTPCHRLTTADSFEVLQCGDPTGSGTGGPGYTYGPVENAPSKTFEKDGVTYRTYEAGTVAMARASGDGKSMGSQFFLVYGDTDIPDDAAGGYTVLGKITKGLDVVKKVAKGGVADGSTDGTPVSAVSIKSTTVSG
ncbi:peptidylprolyl isomerase [Kineosporia mesophila]|uniref:Peptidylprolyl isomerase n=1 Tax=Kineosporia mesophila TaxID=566012 RepID=A0ABP7AQF5_9ACTN|nr:peptidylprolyl isomerase [Kineosporia mesophila]